MEYTYREDDVLNVDRGFGNETELLIGCGIKF